MTKLDIAPATDVRHRPASGPRVIGIVEMCHGTLLDGVARTACLSTWRRITAGWRRADAWDRRPETPSQGMHEHSGTAIEVVRCQHAAVRCVVRLFSTASGCHRRSGCSGVAVLRVGRSDDARTPIRLRMALWGDGRAQVRNVVSMRFVRDPAA